VLEAADWDSALNILAEHPDVAVLFTDVGLPGLNGRQLADEARRRMPNGSCELTGVSCALCSGRPFIFPARSLGCVFCPIRRIHRHAKPPGKRTLIVIQITENAPTRIYTSRLVTHANRAGGSMDANAIATAGVRTKPATIFARVGLNSKGLPIARQKTIYDKAEIRPIKSEMRPKLAYIQATYPHPSA
jgi:CheY-like chemotaxis protein